MIGIEHEFRVLDPTGTVVDFEPLCARLPIDGLNVDVLDRSAWRTPDGFLICADDAEAEIATPPLTPVTGLRAVAAQAARAAYVLTEALPAPLGLEGYSTHISISVDDDLVVDVAHLFAQSYAPALMLLLDDRETPGLLIRPRRDRLELGGSYRGGDDLVAALGMALGGTRHCVEAVRARSTAGMPPLVRVRSEWGDQRFGWYVDRTSFGGDLYAERRESRLERRQRSRFGRRRTVSGQRHLELCWKQARARLGDIGPEELTLVDQRVSGVATLPSERDLERAPVLDSSVPLRTPLGRMTRELRYEDGTLTPVIVGWDFVVYRAEAGGFIAVPASSFEEFGDAADANRLGELITSIPRHGRAMDRASDAASLGWFDSILDRRLLMPAERSAAELRAEVCLDAREEW